jgi:hypothetical protein
MSTFRLPRPATLHLNAAVPQHPDHPSAPQPIFTQHFASNRHGNSTLLEQFTMSCLSVCRSVCMHLSFPHLNGTTVSLVCHGGPRLTSLRSPWFPDASNKLHSPLSPSASSPLAPRQPCSRITGADIAPTHRCPLDSPPDCLGNHSCKLFRMSAFNVISELFLKLNELNKWNGTLLNVAHGTIPTCTEFMHVLLLCPAGLCA